MKLLKTINLENIDPVSTADWKHRVSARAVVVNSAGQIGILFVSKHNFYKLPGGGVEEGEDVRTALDRELEEELGVAVDVDGEIGTTKEYRARFKLVQDSHCFLARTSATEGTPKFTADEVADGMQVLWVEPSKALELLNLGKTLDYEGGYIEQRETCFMREATKLLKGND